MQVEELEGARLAFSMAASLVYGEPDTAMLDRFLMPGLFEESPFGGTDEDVSRGLAAMAAWCDEMCGRADHDGGLAALRDDWFQLFAGPGEPAAPAWAGYYMATNSQILSEESLAVRRIYARHGFAPMRKNREPDDDLGIMLGFLGQLASEAAAAEMAGDDRAGRHALDDARVLLGRHILPWIGVWRERVVAKARTSFYRGVGDFVFGLVHSYAEGLGMKATR